MTIAEMKTEIDAVRLKLVYAHGIELTDLTYALNELRMSLILAQERVIAHSHNKNYSEVV